MDVKWGYGAAAWQRLYTGGGTIVVPNELLRDATSLGPSLVLLHATFSSSER